MLLQNELQFVEIKMVELSKKHDLQSYANELKERGEYKDFLTSLSWYLIRAACGINYICSLYEKYGANDTHITTLAKQSIKVLNLNL